MTKKAEKVPGTVHSANARYFVLGYGSNDLDKWPEVEATSARIVENLDSMVRAIGGRGRLPILLDVLDANGPSLSREEAERLGRMTTSHNDRLGRYARSSRVPLVVTCGKLREGHFADSYHPNDDGARIIAEEVFRVLAEARRAEGP